MVIEFWATWDGPCRFIGPVFEKFSGAEEYEKVRFLKVDVDEQQKVAEEVGIRAMPSFITFHNGLKIEELVGANPQALQMLLSKAAGLA